MKFKIGDRVRSRQPDIKYTGTIVSIGDDKAFVSRDADVDEKPWACEIHGDRIATAYGLWDKESYLEKIGGSSKKLVNLTKFVAFYDLNNVDPMKEFADRAELVKWLKEAREDRSIKWESIKVFEVKNPLRVIATTRISLRKA